MRSSLKWRQHINGTSLFDVKILLLLKRLQLFSAIIKYTRSKQASKPDLPIPFIFFNYAPDFHVKGYISSFRNGIRKTTDIAKIMQCCAIAWDAQQNANKFSKQIFDTRNPVIVKFQFNALTWRNQQFIGFISVHFFSDLRRNSASATALSFCLNELELGHMGSRWRSTSLWRHCRLLHRVCVFEEKSEVNWRQWWSLIARLGYRSLRHSGVMDAGGSMPLLLSWGPQGSPCIIGGLFF